MKYLYRGQDALFLSVLEKLEQQRAVAAQTTRSLTELEAAILSGNWAGFKLSLGEAERHNREATSRIASVPRPSRLEGLSSPPPLTAPTSAPPTMRNTSASLTAPLSAAPAVVRPAQLDASLHHLNAATAAFKFTTPQSDPELMRLLYGPEARRTRSPVRTIDPLRPNSEISRRIVGDPFARTAAEPTVIRPATEFLRTAAASGTGWRAAPSPFASTASTPGLPSNSSSMMRSPPSYAGSSTPAGLGRSMGSPGSDGETDLDQLNFQLEQWRQQMEAVRTSDHSTCVAAS